MERSNSIDNLFNIIRKELNTIINDGEKEQAGNIKTTERSKSKLDKGVNSKTKRHEDNIPTGSIKKGANSSPTAQTTSKMLPARSRNISPRLTRTSDIVDDKKQTAEFATTVPKSIDISKQFHSIDNPLPKTIDEDVQKMQVDLMESYELFKSIGEKFESINFGRLQSRIKDLNLSAKRDLVGGAKADEIRDVLENGFKMNNLDNLTKEMGEKFRNHPGEFGDIPELSSFFQACTQLEHGLDNLKRQRNDITDLGNRISRAANANYDRITEIQHELHEKTNAMATANHDKNQ